MYTMSKGKAAFFGASSCCLSTPFLYVRCQATPLLSLPKLIKCAFCSEGPPHCCHKTHGKADNGLGVVVGHKGLRISIKNRMPRKCVYHH